jgi:hypothetical protein
MLEGAEAVDVIPVLALILAALAVEETALCTPATTQPKGRKIRGVVVVEGCCVVRLLVKFRQANREDLGLL